MTKFKYLYLCRRKTKISTNLYIQEYICKLTHEVFLIYPAEFTTQIYTRSNSHEQFSKRNESIINILNNLKMKKKNIVLLVLPRNV